MSKIYACGGAGVNIASALTSTSDVVFVDTSKSNLGKVPEGSEIFLVDGMDGAGKQQGITYEGFGPVAKHVLIQHKPSDGINIVLTSLSGGSGSMIAPILTRTLIEDGRNTVVIGVYSANSMIELKNTINSLKSFNGIARKIGSSVCMFYVEKPTQKEANADAIWFIETMRIITDPDNTEGFDSSDLRNFLRFDRVTSSEPTLAFIDITDVESSRPKPGTRVVSTLHIHDGNHSSMSPPIPEYIADIVLPQGLGEEMNDIRMDALLGLPAATIKRISEMYKEFDNAREVNRVQVIPHEDSEDGIFF